MLCPYCGNDANQITGDHIFPNFLGGRRTIPTCASCNNTFGSRFESRAARQLLAFQLMLCSLGIPEIAPKEGTRWRNAYEWEGTLCDLEWRNGEAVLVYSKPKVIRDDLHAIVSVETRSMREAEKHLRNSGKDQFWQLEEFNTPVPFNSREFAFNFGPDFGRLVIKMCAALATLLPSFIPDDINQAIRVLKSDDPLVHSARRDFRSFPAVDNAVPPFSHALYIEHNPTGIHGIATIFGAFRMYCRLGSCDARPEPVALIGTLDVSNGEEIFREVPPHGLTEAPLLLQTIDRERGAKVQIAELQRQISLCGAKGWSIAAESRAGLISSLWQSSTVNTNSKSWSGSTMCSGDECTDKNPK